MLAFLFLVIFVDKLLEQGMRWHNINQSITGIIESDVAFFIDLLKYFKKFQNETFRTAKRKEKNQAKHTSTREYMNIYVKV